MSEYKRTSPEIKKHADIGTGPYMARIVSHLDPTYMGSLEVTLLRNQGNKIGDDSQSYVVRCAMPFFGYTGYEFMGQNTCSSSTEDGFNDTQKSYGMWFVPPDVGVNVLVMFVDGDPAQGYWIGCVPSRFANHMVPGIAGSSTSDCSGSDKKKYNTSQPLPTAEINRRLNAVSDQEKDVNKIKKPVHPIADRFLEQGLLEDDIRGVTTSSARREVPSMVFGISTPGPLDARPGAKKSIIGKKQSLTAGPVPVSRLGGTQLVMDDGDSRFQRKKSASEGPVEYVDVVAGGKGDPTIPYHEHFRIRTRTGHQILLHNSEDLIYIGNARGTTWIELSSNGKIDIFAEDSISIHTKNDLNLRADRDINLEAGRNINLRTETGRLHADIFANMEITVGKDNLITTKGNLHINTVGENNLTSDKTTNVRSATNNNFKAGNDTNLLSGNWHIENSPRRGSLPAKGRTRRVSEVAKTSDQTDLLKLHDNLVTNRQLDWASTKYQDTVPLKSIMKRVPMHEPWALHENQAPDQLKPENTDREK